jgi:hypothetical protein
MGNWALPIDQMLNAQCSMFNLPAGRQVPSAKWQMPNVQ